MTLALTLLKSNAMSISSNTSMIIAAAAIARFLAFEHLRMSRDTVALALWDLVILVLWLSRGWSPCQIVSTNLDIVVGEFAKLVVVHSEELGFL